MEAKELISKVLVYLKNKYILVSLVFIFLMLFIDRNNLFTQLGRAHDLRQLRAQKEFYEKEIDSAKNELRRLRSNPNILQNYAREQLLMSKDNEDVYILDSLDSVPEKK